MKRKGGLRRRWFLNTVGIVLTLGFACVFAVTAVFAAYSYNNLKSDLYNRADTATDIFSDYTDQSMDAFCLSCASYARSYEDDSIELQFLDTQGKIVASSREESVGLIPGTPEILEAVSCRGVSAYTAPDRGIIAVSGPLIYSDGEVIGVLRFVASTGPLDARILQVALVALVTLVIISVVVLISSNFYIRSILVPMGEITEKAQRIAGGTYGIQIQKKYDDEFGELVDTINEMSAQINQTEKMQTEFISSLSHELRTPLTAITGWSETLLSSDTLDPETRRGMRIISREAKRLTEMVVELLDFTQIQDGRMTLNLEPTDIRAEFEDMVYMYSSRVAQDGIELEYLENDDDIPVIPCDPKRLRQIFLNILDNAAKHGGEGKRIEASMRFESNTVVVRIRDYGPGIPEDELPLVKKKFYKGSSKARGTGIGLAVCDEIVEMHGGTLTLENAPGGGTLVTVRLPAAQ